MASAERCFGRRTALDLDYQILVSTNGNSWNFNGDGTEVIYSREISVEDVDADTELVTLELFPDVETPTVLFARIDAILF